MLRTLLICSAVALTTACATVEPVKVEEVTRDVKSVTFVQNGKQPMRYLVGAVDGATFWSGAAVIGTPANPDSKADQQAAAGATVISLIGQTIARASIESDPGYYTRVLDKMIEGRDLASEAGRGVLPALAGAWGVPYAESSLVVLSEARRLTDDALLYTGDDPGADLVLAFTLTQVVVTEKLSLKGPFAAMLTLGLNSKEVMPIFTGELSAYRRSPQGSLKRIWTASCHNSFVDAPSEQWSALRDEPALGAPMFDGNLARFISACGNTARRELVAAK